MLLTLIIYNLLQNKSCVINNCIVDLYGCTSLRTGKDKVNQLRGSSKPIGGWCEFIFIKTCFKII